MTITVIDGSKQDKVVELPDTAIAMQVRNALINAPDDLWNLDGLQNILQDYKQYVTNMDKTKPNEICLVFNDYTAITIEFTKAGIEFATGYVTPLNKNQLN